MGTKYRLSLPRTKLPLRVNAAQHEVAVQKLANIEQHYYWQQKRNTKKSFVLHDGPPYANGEAHMGHVLNRVLKDITNRYKAMTGHCVYHQPGWDCHGLPIELKVFQEGVTSNVSPLDVRKRARKFAEKAIKQQMSSFKRWGLMADWENPYTTMDKEYEANQIKVFFEMYKKGLIYQGVKPVYWSPSSHTALAEAELEYRDKVSSAAYVKFPIHTVPCVLDSIPNNAGTFHAIIWTTTPWTLMANRAICYNPNLQYSVLRSSDGEHVIVSSNKAKEIQYILGLSCEVVAEFNGSQLSESKYTNPLRPDDGLLPFLPGDHVTASSGTGLVHTAPAHGPEDYQIGLKYNLTMFCPVNEHGLYTQELGERFSGMDVLSNGNSAVLRALQEMGLLVHSKDYVHRYPHDWRTKQPVIIRTTKQWFAAVGGIAPAEALKGVKMIPEVSYHRLAAMLEGRQDWCISRQRSWGVPIPVFYHKESADHLMNDSTIEHIRHTFTQYGSDSWWKLPVAKLLPPSLSHEHDMYEPGSDTMDVWFDSGSSWATLLKDHDGQADVYLEGSDQYRGWFQSSLITSYITQGKAPYRSIVCHGFVLDSGGLKMSKSIGNVISPNDIIETKKFGADTMRLWVASSDFTSDVNLSEQILKQTNDSLQKLRSTCRFLVGNLSDFSPDNHLVPYDNLRTLDQYILHLLYNYCEQVGSSYEAYHFSKIYHLVVNLATKDLSAFYFDIIKDCLYCSDPGSVERRSVQTVLFHITNQFIMTLAPILPHLTEEVALNCPFPHEGAFKRGWKSCPPEWLSPGAAQLFTTIRQVRDVVMKALDEARTSKAIRSSLNATVSLHIEDKEFVDHLDRLFGNPEELLSDVFVVSGVDMLSQQFDDSKLVFQCSGTAAYKEKEFQVLAVVHHSTKHKCPRCWKYHSPAEDELCQRCHVVESNCG